MLPDDGPKGPKHVGVIKGNIIYIKIVTLYVLIKGALVGRIILYTYMCHWSSYKETHSTFLFIEMNQGGIVYPHF